MQKGNEKKQNRRLYFRKYLYFLKEKEYIWGRKKSDYSQTYLSNLGVIGLILLDLHAN
ncbi:hypothetical protein FLAVO9R_70134 [Flavobacterium sp. 9R]|nr:hypothetical protein FLAVO9R_70134 [Flavobacterium sp. 9R]